MTEVSIKHVAPALVIVVEVEGPTRLEVAAAGQPDRRALLNWVGSSPLRAALVEAAIKSRDDPGRTESWLDLIPPAEPASGHARQP